MLERSTYLVLAMPGLVIALALAYFSEQYGGGLWYQTAPMLVLAYAIMFFPLALVGVRASVAQAPGRSGERRPVARSGAPGRALAGDQTARRPRPGGRLLPRVPLRGDRADRYPHFGADRCADPCTQFWSYQQNLAYGQAAPFALLMIAIAAVPSYVLGRFFDRLPACAAAS